jgi:hypothetical protein
MPAMNTRVAIYRFELEDPRTGHYELVDYWATLEHIEARHGIPKVTEARFVPLEKVDLEGRFMEG